MAATVVLTATTLEAQILEIATKGQVAESNYNSLNPDDTVNRISITPDLENGNVQISISIPVTLSSAGDDLVLTAATYM